MVIKERNQYKFQNQGYPEILVYLEKKRVNKR